LWSIYISPYAPTGPLSRRPRTGSNQLPSPRRVFFGLWTPLVALLKLNAVRTMPMAYLRIGSLAVPFGLAERGANVCAVRRAYCC